MGKGTLILWRIRLYLRILLHWILEALRYDNRLHRARFAKINEAARLLTPVPPPESLLLGRRGADFVAVSPTKTRSELGNLLVVAPTRGGKGLLAVSQLLTWNHSVIVNDITGDLFTQTAGYRSTLGPVFVIDPTGIGHCFDPLHASLTEDEFYSPPHTFSFRPTRETGPSSPNAQLLCLHKCFSPQESRTFRLFPMLGI